MSSATFEGVRVLLLGDGPRTRVARRLLVEQGAVLERHFNSKVTYVVIDRTVPQHNPQVAAAKRAAIPVLTTSELQKWPGMEPMADARAMPVSPSPMVPALPAVPHPPIGPAPMPMWRPAPSRMDPTLVGLGWGAVALLSGGIGTPILVGVAASRLSSRSVGVAATTYAVLPILTFFAWVVGLGTGFDPLAMLALFGWLGTIGAGAVHSYILAHRVRAHEDANAKRPLGSSDPRNARVLAELQHRKRLRGEAREIIHNDPHTARQLRIGRPDLQRTFDDGGLIDVNNVPAGVLIALPGITPDIAEQVVNHRETVGAFMSTSDLVVYTDLDPRHTDELEELALFT